MPLLTRKKQVIVAIEGVEGTAASIAASDAVLAYDPVFNFSPEMFDRNPSRSSLTSLQSIVGKRPGQITFRTELKGSGAVATRPEWDKAIRICGFTAAAVSTLGVGGTISGGPFQPAETVTGSSSSAAARVVGEISTGTTTVHIAGIAGTFNTDDVLTGSVSGATVGVSRAAAASKGWEYLPASSNVPSGTVAVYKDGSRGVLKGCRGNAVLTGNVGEPLFLEFTIDGVFSAYSDQALETLTLDTTQPPAFLDSGHRFRGDTTPFASLSIDMQNTTSQREDARDTNGIKSFLITGRNPQLSIDPEEVLVATENYRERLKDASTGYFYAKAGATAGNAVRIGAPKIQYMEVGDTDRNGIATADITFSLVATDVNSGDKEVQVAVV
jgi:hypothetical protein